MFVNPNPNKIPIMSTLRQERRVFAADKHAVERLAELLATLLGELDPQGYRQPVLLAVGTGPLHRGQPGTPCRYTHQ